MGLDNSRLLLKAHVKGYTRVVNGKVVYVPDYEAQREAAGGPVGRMAQLHERTVIGKHKNGSHYLRATDAEDGKHIQAAAEKLGIPVTKRRAGANHFGRTGAYDHYHVDSPEHALALHEELKKVHDTPNAEPGTIAKIKEQGAADTAANQDAARVRNGIPPKGKPSPADLGNIARETSKKVETGERSHAEANDAHRAAEQAHFDAAQRASAKGDGNGEEYHLDEAAKHQKAAKEHASKEHAAKGANPVDRAEAATKATHGLDFDSATKPLSDEDLEKAKVLHAEASGHHITAMDHPGADRDHHSKMADMHAQDATKIEAIQNDRAAKNAGGAGKPPAEPPKVATGGEDAPKGPKGSYGARDMRPTLDHNMARKAESWKEVEESGKPIKGSDDEVAALKHLHEVHGVHEVGSRHPMHEIIGHKNAGKDERGRNEPPLEFIAHSGTTGHHYYVNTEGYDYARYARHIPDEVMAKVKGEAKPEQEQEHYRGGDKVRFTGNTQDLHGGKFHEFEYLEGHKKGQKGVTQHGPNGEAPEPKQDEHFHGKVPQVEPLGAKPVDEPVTVRPAGEGQGHSLPPKPEGGEHKTKIAAPLPKHHPARIGHEMAQRNDAIGATLMHRGEKIKTNTHKASKEAMLTSQIAEATNTPETHEAAALANSHAAQAHEIASNTRRGGMYYSAHSAAQDHHQKASFMHGDKARELRAAAAAKADTSPKPDSGFEDFAKAPSLAAAKRLANEAHIHATKAKNAASELSKSRADHTIGPEGGESMRLERRSHRQRLSTGATQLKHDLPLEAEGHEAAAAAHSKVEAKHRAAGQHDVADHHKAAAEAHTRTAAMLRAVHAAEKEPNKNQIQHVEVPDVIGHLGLGQPPSKK